MDKLRKCPFCGGKAECFRDKLGEWSVCCYDEYNDYDCCEVETSKYSSYDLAADAWNTRATDPRPETIKDFKPMSNAEESAWREE